jgi:hypothetical protein
MPNKSPRRVVMEDFIQYPEDVLSQISGRNGCVWALGRLAQSVKEDEYLRIHVYFPLAAVGALKKASVGSESKPFDFV